MGKGITENVLFLPHHNQADISLPMGSCGKTVHDVHVSLLSSAPTLGTDRFAAHTLDSVGSLVISDVADTI